MNGLTRMSGVAGVNRIISFLNDSEDIKIVYNHEGKPNIIDKIPVTVIRRLPENQMEKLLSQV